MLVKKTKTSTKEEVDQFVDVINKIVNDVNTEAYEVNNYFRGFGQSPCCLWPYGNRSS